MSPPRHRSDRPLPATTVALQSAVEHGFTVDELRSPSFARPFRGLRSRSECGDSLLERSVACAPLLREEDRFSHLSALVLYGCPIRVAPDELVHVESRYGSGIRRTEGIRGHTWRSSKIAEARRIRVEQASLRTASPARALLQSAGMLPFRELVVAVDHLIRVYPKRLSWLTVHEISRFAAEAPGLSGLRLRRAVEIARVGAESRMETLLRLAGVRAGVGELALQVEVYDSSGRWIGRFDLADELVRELLEYDGEQHRTSRKQYLRDLDRLERARKANWNVTRFHREDVLDRPAETGQRMLEILGRSPVPVEQALATLLDEPLPAHHVTALPRSELWQY